VNKSLLDTDILSEIIKGFDQTVASNAATYRRAFGHYKGRLWGQTEFQVNLKLGLSP
jgi:hypothetical protein